MAERVSSKLQTEQQGDNGGDALADMSPSAQGPHGHLAAEGNTEPLVGASGERVREQVSRASTFPETLTAPGELYQSGRGSQKCLLQTKL